jgi:hypothetical protein
MGACTACSHGERGAIDASLCRGTSYRTLAKRYSLSVAALGRHRRSHIPERLRNKAASLALVGAEVDLDRLRASESENLLAHICNQRAKLYELLDLAEAGGDVKSCCAVHSRISATLELGARVLGEIAGHATTIQNTLVISSEYLALRAALLKALAPSEFRAARQAVSAALRAIEATKLEHDAIDAVATPLSGPVAS